MPREIDPHETNSQVDKRQRRLDRRNGLKCPICPPNRGENAKRKARHGDGKPRYKDKR